MKRGTLAHVLALVLTTTTIASANPNKVLVLQSEGRVDPKIRAKIDATIVKLARTGADQISPGEITYSDAAALVGCKPEEASCKDDVIATLSVDEIVITNVTAKPGGLEVHVRRVAKGGASREATTVVAADKADQLDQIAPLFVTRTVGPEPPTPTTPPTTTPTTPTTSVEPKPADQPPDLTKFGPATSVEPTVKPTEVPAGNDERPRPWNQRKYQIAGMATGGGMFLIGLILWGSANGVESDIDKLTVRSQADLVRLRELEDKGDSYAGWGNFFALGGLALGGVSTYFYFKGRRARNASTARLTPTLFDHGAGVALTFGASP